MKCRRRKSDEYSRQSEGSEEEKENFFNKISSWGILLSLSTLLLVGGVYVSFRVKLEECNLGLLASKRENLALEQNTRTLEHKLHSVLQEKLTAVEDTLVYMKKQDAELNNVESLRKKISDLSGQLTEKSIQLNEAQQELTVLRHQIKLKN